MMISCPNCGVPVCKGWTECHECRTVFNYRVPTERIKISVITEMTFDNEKDFLSYLESPEVQAITTFPEELKEAFETQEPVHVKTLRPKVGAVTRSEITVRKA